MIVNAYLDITPQEWENIKKKYVKPGMYRIIKNTRREHKRCDDCHMYTSCTAYEGFCLETNDLVCGNNNCDNYQ